MRKVTGYIGALIVVVALMGSILAGYALNVNGQSEVVNEYENVTDVSGLYSHTDQKTYIDYNPASNYIGYELGDFENPLSGSVPMKRLYNGTITINPSTNKMTVNGNEYSSPNAVLFFSDKFFVQKFSNSNTRYSGYNIANVQLSSEVTITLDSSGTATVTGSGINATWTGLTLYVAYNGTEDYDYLQHSGRQSGYTNPIEVYLNDINSFASLGRSPNGYDTMTVGQTVHYKATSTTATLNISLTQGQRITNSVYKLDVNYNIDNYTAWFVFWPLYVSSGDTGIDYTESNRVNNYPIEYIYSENTEIQTLPQIDLKSVSATSYFPDGYDWIITPDIIKDMTFTYNGTTYSQWQGVNIATNRPGDQDNMKYRLSDLVATMDIPVGTSQLIFDTGTFMGRELVLSDTVSGVTNTGRYIPSNLVAIGSDSSLTNNTYMTGSGYGAKAYYTISTGLVDTYNKEGVKLSTSALSDTYVQFNKNSDLYGPGYYQKGLDSYGYYRNINIVFHWTASPGNSANNPYLNVTAITNGAVENVKYLDVTKGIRIDQNNVSDTTWNNEYENGNIQLLFRAEDVGSVYHNELEVSGNTISVDYDDSRFYVTLNNGDAVDIGTWRSIILDINLKNGDLSAIPVRTFNSYTNVQTDNTSIPIGNMTDYAASNTIVWKPTANSLTFNVYSTSVFMNTYGVVMVDPSITITDYFTNLDNFYRLELNNFSIYGDSITINNQVGEVSGNHITFDNESVIIKKLYITYADGNVYLSDGSTQIDLGALESNNVVFGGAWYFKTILQKGYTDTKQVYTWDWQTFILDNTEFCIIYMGLVLAAFIVARKYCAFTVMDYVVLGISLIIAFGVQVIA